jgi:hypothetical protein
MSNFQKAAVINLGVITGLAIQYWKGTRLPVLIVSGILLLVVANLTIVILTARKKQDASKSK